jgi:hypothetical protein
VVRDGILHLYGCTEWPRDRLGGRPHPAAREGAKEVELAGRSKCFAGDWLPAAAIFDKQLGKWYFAFNPAFDRSLHGASVDQGFTFSPNFKVSYDFTKKVTGGFEYYGSTGPVTGFDPISEQQQQFFPAIDLNLSPKWEVNFGVGVGVTRSTDHLIAKMILGYRFDF